MNINDFRITSTKAIVYLTNNYSKSPSVISSYSIAERILTDFIIKRGGFNISEVIEWIESNKVNWYKGKFKAIKRLAYSIYDFECNNSFTTNTFIYYNTNQLINFTSNDNAVIIQEFIKSKGVSCSNPGNIRNILSHLSIYLSDNNLQLDELTLDDFEKIYYYFKRSFTDNYFNRSIGVIKSYVNFYSSKYNKAIPMSFILSNKLIDHLAYLKSVVNSTEVIDIGADCEQVLTQEDFNYININNFINEMKQHNFSKTVTKHIDYQLRTFNLFLYLVDYRYSNKLVEYWTDNIIKPVTKGYLSYRNIILRYVDFISGKLCIKKVYPRVNRKIKFSCKPSKFDTLLPVWSKDIVFDYLKYRRRLGYTESTITNDKSAILTLCLFLDKQGFDFEEISPRLLIEYSKNEIHQSLSGKNNYISRVKVFVTYLQDIKVIPIFNLSTILEGCRVPKKVVTTLNDELVRKIYQLKDNLEGAVELRAYAIFLIGIRLGIRSSDIVNLKFENISLKDRTISFIQSKTRKFIVLPIPTDVANAIYKYVKDGRAKCESEYIFISRDAPYTKISRSICGMALKKLINMVGCESDEINGFHILRRTYASNLLKERKNISDVALALGHSTNFTVDKYLNINKEYSYLCPLELDKIPYGGKRL